MRVTAKGQVTIPQDVRKRLGILPGSDVAFVIEGKAAKLKIKGHNLGRGRQIVERLRGRGTVNMSTDQIMALTRGAR